MDIKVGHGGVSEEVSPPGGGDSKELAQPQGRSKTLTKCRLRGRVEMAREIDANLSRALKRGLILGEHGPGNGRGTKKSVEHLQTDGSDDDIDFDEEDLEALSAFSSMFGGLPAVRLGLVDISQADDLKDMKK